jgi:hypothetical protein
MVVLKKAAKSLTTDDAEIAFLTAYIEWLTANPIEE